MKKINQVILSDSGLTSGTQALRKIRIPAHWSLISHWTRVKIFFCMLLPITASGCIDRHTQTSQSQVATTNGALPFNEFNNLPGPGTDVPGAANRTYEDPITLETFTPEKSNVIWLPTTASGEDVRDQIKVGEVYYKPVLAETGYGSFGISV